MSRAATRPAACLLDLICRVSSSEGHDSIKNKVVLFYRPYGGPPLGAPLCLLQLAVPLLEGASRFRSLTAPSLRNTSEWLPTKLGSGAVCISSGLPLSPPVPS